MAGARSASQLMLSGRPLRRTTTVGRSGRDHLLGKLQLPTRKIERCARRMPHRSSPPVSPTTSTTASARAATPDGLFDARAIRRRCLVQDPGSDSSRRPPRPARERRCVPRGTAALMPSITVTTSASRPSPVQLPIMSWRASASGPMTAIVRADAGQRQHVAVVLEQHHRACGNLARGSPELGAA